ncbi:MAG: hypothetical protein JST68_29375 [Bacteroidetes bacterium]|nr:hypothetical protein [Bacteroidota bacterium]
MLLRTQRAIANIEALQGQVITELNRWEEVEWEIFTDSEAAERRDDARVVSLGAIIGIDETLLAALNLDVGKGI